ncbi:helix-turn-helix domain-containing protein [Streptomyces phaeoluteigriseus]|uniref:Helix-turn-helix domain-containing protein n=1 Tax=Streptomyces phaeoluteigriseus TaxID=114686 RepID=A0ABY4ZAF5_9ACTN|nr:helix-turn-helix transcriptional regulator [Streptomyces phaeoluteigriseus]USQ86017.1 helix-turn-helix domain-containing protein [Streptomyces phaeoluteigriseus]
MDSFHDDVAEFALLLTRLKERTDRSYAALARRLDVHASTLHRYCSGEAVPQDFAGIERFAALCGASPEERTELHRRWIVAAAARQRPRPSDTRKAPAPHSSTSAAASIAPASHSASAVSASGRSPAVEVPRPISSADQRPEPTSPPRPRLHGGRPRLRPVRSRALAASLVAALLGLTASAAGPPSASATHNGNPKANQASAGTVPPVAPLTWTANSHTRGLTGCGESYVLAKPPQQVPPPPHPEDIAAWAASQRAVHGGTSGVRITVQGRGSAAVVLEALHVRVVSRLTPATGRKSVYSLSDGCGAALIPRFFSVNLDADQPLARSTPGDNGVGTPIPAIDFPYRVSLQEPEVLMVSALTESCTCDWHLDLEWSSQGRTGTVRIDDHGRPFRTTSTKGLPGYRYDRIYHHPGRWVPIPAANMAASD